LDRRRDKGFEIEVALGKIHGKDTAKRAADEMYYNKLFELCGTDVHRQSNEDVQVGKGADECFQQVQAKHSQRQ
jgi:hypothetical protein